ncbi:uncharacterized protein GrlHz isoform X3 [Anabrus simplex]|uniref:uncharacterized protein GrlHz isoform X3 n=1 Tax=Anabrus simplex TaxID=316456 RepID=UPI0034DD4F75
MAETEENGDNRTLQRSPAPSSTSSSSIDINSIDMIAEITEDTPHESLSTSAVLYYCKRKILHPYLRLLSVMGLRSSTQDIPGSRRCMTILSYVYLVEVTFLLCAGYVLQSLSCFRRDRGFCYKKQPKHLSFTDKYEQICYGSLPFTYIIPSVLHLSAYLYAVYLFRCKENEQLQNLMERVFLLSSSHSDGPLRQRQLVRKLWLFIGLSIVWMVFSLVSINVMMADGNIIFHWFENSSAKWKVFLKVLLVISTLCHDMAQTILITSYCLQGQLLRSYLHFLGAKMLQHSMLPLDWLREIGEFQKLLLYLNEDFAPIVGIFTVINVSWAASGIVWILNYDAVDKTAPIKGISILNVLMWVLISIAPFLQRHHSN